MSHQPSVKVTQIRRRGGTVVTPWSRRSLLGTTVKYLVGIDSSGDMMVSWAGHSAAGGDRASRLLCTVEMRQRFLGPTNG